MIELAEVVRQLRSELESARVNTFELAEDGRASSWISVGHDFSFVLFEEHEPREVLDEQLAAARYSWQRVPSVLRDVPSGR